MCKLPILSLLLVLCLGCSACAHKPAAKARTLMAVGALGVAGGLLVTGGCAEESTAGCGSPGGGSLGVGLPLLAAGAAVLATGIALKPKATAPLRYRDPLPPPVMPDPLVRPLSEPGPRASGY